MPQPRILLSCRRLLLLCNAVTFPSLNLVVRNLRLLLGDYRIRMGPGLGRRIARTDRLVVGLTMQFLQGTQTRPARRIRHNSVTSGGRRRCGPTTHQALRRDAAANRLPPNIPSHRLLPE